MAFCSITDQNLEALYTIVNVKINSNPNRVNDIKSFAKEVFEFLKEKNIPEEKAISMTSHIPQIIIDYYGDKKNRARFKQLGLTIDKAVDAEDTFDDDKALVKFLELGEAPPEIVITDKQTEALKKVDGHISATKAEVTDDGRKINGKLYPIRVTSIAKVGFDENILGAPESSPALVVGNYVDQIAKDVFDGKVVNKEDWKGKLSDTAFDSLVSQLMDIKKGMEEQGYTFRTGVTVYDPETGLSGEIDLLVIDKDGEGRIYDFKTGKQRMDMTHLQNDTLTLKSVDLKATILSKAKAYATQGNIYSKMAAKQLGIPVSSSTWIIGLGIKYDPTTATPVVDKIINSQVMRLGTENVRSEFSGKSLSEIVAEYKKLQGSTLGTITEVPAKRRQLKTPRKGKENPLDRISSINEVAATDEELQKEVDWLRNGPLGKDLLLNIDKVVNSGLFGQFTTDGITLFKNASKGTGYHEGWHRFSQVFMSPDQKLKLYDSVRADGIDFTTRDGRKLNTATADLVDVEEFLAEEFAKYALKPEEYNYPSTNSEPKTLFQRVWDFLKRFFGANPRPIDLFQKLYSGKIDAYKPSVNNAFWGTLNSIATNSRGVDIVSNERFPLWRETFDGLIADQLKKYNKSFTAFKQSKNLQKAVLDNIFESLTDKYNTDQNLTDQQEFELASILENEHEFTNIYLKNSSYDTLKDFSVSDDVFTMTADEIAAMVDISDEYNEFDELEGEEADQESKPERFDRAGNEESVLSVASTELTDFFRTIPKVKEVKDDNSYVYELNELGYPTNHSYYDMFYRTKRFLSGKFNMQDMLDAMSDLSNQRRFPELKLINDMIQSFMSDTTEKNPIRKMQNVMFIQSFFNTMVMPEISNTQLTLNFNALNKQKSTYKPTMVTYRKAFRNLSMKIMQGWEKDFRDVRGREHLSFDQLSGKTHLVSSSPLYVSEDGNVYLNPFVSWTTLYNPNKIESLRDFYNMIGVKLNAKVYEDPAAIAVLRSSFHTITQGIAKYAAYLNADLGLEKGDSLSSYFSKMLPEEVDAIAKTNFIASPIRTFSERREFQGKSSPIVIPSMRYLFESIAEMEEMFGDKVSSGAFKIEDKTKYPYYVPNQVSITTELLNGIDNVSEFNEELYLSHMNPTKYPWMKRSLFLSKMFDSDGNRVVDKGQKIRFVLEDMASVRTQNEGTIIEKSPRSLTKTEKLLFDILTMFSAGKVEVPRAETSSTIFSLGLSSYGNGSNMPIQYKDIQGKGAIGEKFYDIVKNAFLGEVEKMNWYRKNEKNNPLKDKLSIFEGILSPELVSDIKAIKSDEVFTEDNGLETKFRKEVEDYFTAIVADAKVDFDELMKNKDYKTMILDTLKVPGASGTTSIVKAFIFNKFALDAEFYNLFFGDLYFYKNPFKRGKIITNTGTSFFVDSLRNQMLNSIKGDSLSSIFTGKKGYKDFRFIKSGTINDVKMNSIYVHDDPSQNRMLIDLINARKDAGVWKEGDFDTLLNKTKKYKGINIADGQGIIGLDFYRNFSIITNIWTDEKEQEYERQKSLLRMKYNLYYKLDNDGNKVDLEGDELAEAKAKDQELAAQKPFHYFNPLKISYTGPQYKEGPLKPVFDKFAVRPIIPEAAFGKRDEHLLLQMLQQDVDYLKFESGTKVHQKTDPAFDWFKKIGDGKYDLNDFKVEVQAPQLLLSAFLKHQLNTEKVKEENILGSQFRKTVFGVKYSPLTKANPSALSRFTELENNFAQAIKDLIAVDENDLFSLLGIEKNGDNYQISDMAKFVKLLNEESLRRGVPINNIDYLQYDQDTKKAKYDIDYAFNRTQITDLLSGLIDDRLRRLKVNGSAFYQVSLAGYENTPNHDFTNPTAEDVAKYGTDGLHYYHLKYKDGRPSKTSSMGVKIAMRGEYEKLLKLKHPDGKIIQGKDYATSLARLNEAMKDTDWKKSHMEKFTMIGYRIPTQNNNFMDHMEIMEFLPASAGGIIIAPVEIVIKSGSDFDIDKMNIIKPTFTHTGQIVKAPEESISEINRHIKESVYTERDAKSLNRQLDRLLNGTDSDISQLLKYQRKVRLTMLDLIQRAGVDDTLVDKMVQEAMSHKNITIPDDIQKIPEAEAFSDVDENAVEDPVGTIWKTLDQFNMIDQRIEALKVQYEQFQDEKKVLEEEHLTWFNKKRSYKNAKNNEIVDILRETMSHPYYYELFVTPSTAEDLEEITNDLIASQKNMDAKTKAAQLQANDGKLFDTSGTPADNMKYKTQLTVFDNVLGKRKDLGGYAIQRTFADIFDFINFSVAKKYTAGQDKSSYDKTLFTPLIDPAVRDKFVKDGRIKMHGDNVNNRPIRDIFDQAISATVDLMTSPFYSYMGINMYNKKHFQFLIHQGVDPKTAIYFFNQPILQELYKLVEQKRREVQGYTLKHALVELGLKYKFLDNPMLENQYGRQYPKYNVYKKERKQVFDEEVDDYDPEYPSTPKFEYYENLKVADSYLKRPYQDFNEQLAETDNFSLEKLDKAIRENDLKSDLQRKVLAYFASTTEDADNFMKLEFAYNTDTTQYATITSVMRNRENKAAVENSNMFSKDQVEKLQKQSMISPFDYTDKAYKLYRTLFPQLYNQYTIGTSINPGVFSKLAMNVFGAKNVDLERISKIIENDYIEYIYKNFGEYQGYNLSDYFEPLLRNTDGASDHEFFTSRFQNVINKFPELKQIPFVNNLYEDAYFPKEEKIKDSYKDYDNMETRNLFFLRSPDNPTFERNMFTNNWRNLINFDPRKLGLPDSYSPEDVREISNLFNEMVYFSLYQSGLTNNSNGFSDLIPWEYWAPFVTKSFDKLKEASEKNDKFQQHFTDIFENRFKEMNPKVNWGTKDIQLDIIDEDTGDYMKKPLEFYKNYYRGKDYRITDDDLGFISHALKKSRPIRKELNPGEPIEKKAELGRYIKYEGNVYIVVKKQKGEGIWRVYNPTKTGKEATKSISEKNMELMEEMGKITTYGNREYLVTSKNAIIDMETFKKVNWKENDPARVAILKAAQDQKKDNVDPECKAE